MFNEKLSLQIKIFKRDRILSRGFIILVGFTGIILGINIFNNSTIFFDKVTNTVFYISVIFSVISFWFLIKARWLNINEAIEGTTQQQNVYQKMSIVTLFILLGLLQVEIILMIVLNGTINNSITLVLDIISKYYCLNVLIPMVIIFLITAIIANLENYRLGGILLVIVLLLSSPFMELFEFKLPLLIPIDKILYFIKLPFAYFIQNAGQSIDYLYGFQNELYKLSIILFWSTLFLVAIYKKHIFKNRIFSLITILSLGIIFSTIYIPQSISRNDEHNFGSYVDYNKYEIAERKGQYEKAEKSNYYISHYDLEININRQLNVEGKLKIQSLEAVKKCQFTLYHGYKVKMLKGDNVLSYSQDKDILTVNFANSTNNEVVDISYSGYNQNLYSNYQAVLLPGYFPWYPMAGVKQVYITDVKSSIGNQGYNPYNRIPEASFNVLLSKCRYQVVTNLNQKRENYYQGKSDSLTLIGGNTTVKENKQYLNSLPLYNVFYKDIDLAREQSYKSIQESIKKIFDIDIDFSRKKVISVSTGLAKNNQYSGFSEFNDYIIVPFGGVMDEKAVLEYYGFKNTSLNSSIKDAIILKGVNYDTKKAFINMLMQRINTDLDYYANNKNTDTYRELVQIKDEMSYVIENKEIDSYLKAIGKKLFKEE